MFRTFFTFFPESDFYFFLFAFRESLFDILFNKDMNFEEKLVKVLSKTEAFCGEEIKIRNYKNSLKIYKKTEPIDDKWTQYINDLFEKHETVLNFEKEFQEKIKGDMLYSKILAYTTITSVVMPASGKTERIKSHFSINSSEV